jgi:membrane dipeptidase
MVSAFHLAAALALLAAEKERGPDARVAAVLAATPLVDGHNDLAWAIRDSKRDVAGYDLRVATPGHTDLPRLRAGRVGAQLWSVYVPTDRVAGGHVRAQLEQIDLARRFIARYPDHLALVHTADELLHEFRHGRIAGLLALEGGHTIDDSLAVLRTYHALGARAMTLTHITSTRWADAADQPIKHGGLTAFGEDVVREMNRLGMLVDLSHVADATMDDALRVSQAPVVFTHSAARALTDVPRNVPDEILRRLPANGGLVMVAFVPGFVSQAVADARKAKLKTIPRATLTQVADHVEHIRRVAGVDHVGLGGDFDGITSLVQGLEDVSTYPALLAELARRGWTDADLAKLAGGNFLRVLRAAEATAARLQSVTPP